MLRRTARWSARHLTARPVPRIPGEGAAVLTASAPRVCVVFNPTAGAGDARAAADAMAAEPGIELRRVAEPGRILDVACAAAREGYEIVAAAGGDGTVGGVAAGLHLAGTGAALAVVPMGTANDFARHLGIRRDPLGALRAAREAALAGRRRAVDLIRCESPQLPGERAWALNAVVGGLAGRIGEAIGPERRRRWRRLAYLRAGISDLLRFEALPVQLTVDRRRFDFEALMLVVAGGRFAGGGIPFAPSADPFDGRLDVVGITRTPAAAIPGTLLRVLRGRHAGADNVLALGGRRVELEAGGDFWMNRDGETWVCGPARFEIVPAALHVLLP